MTPSAEPDPPPKKLTLKGAEFESVNAPAGSPASEGTDPMELLRLNREHEKKIGYCEPGPPHPQPRFSRRTREYLTLLISVNLVLGLLLIFCNNPVTRIFLIASIIIFSAGMTWVMLFIFDDY